MRQHITNLRTRLQWRLFRARESMRLAFYSLPLWPFTEIARLQRYAQSLELESWELMHECDAYADGLADLEYEVAYLGWQLDLANDETDYLRDLVDEYALEGDPDHAFDYPYALA